MTEQPGSPDDTPENTKGRPSLAEAALFGCCPRCDARTLFDGPVKFAERCRACGLDFTRFNVGDGPAGFLTLIIGAALTAAQRRNVQEGKWALQALHVERVAAATQRRGWAASRLLGVLTKSDIGHVGAAFQVWLHVCA